MDTIEDIIIYPSDHENPQVFKGEAAKIDVHLSDLFFNYDVSSAINYDNGRWDGYSLMTFRDVADNFIMSMVGLGVPAVEAIGPDDLIRDFLKRV